MLDKAILLAIIKRMKPGVVIAIIVGLLIIGAGGAYLVMRHTNTPMQSASKVAPTSSGMFSSIQDAIARSINLRCDYTYNDIHTVAYIKNGEIRSDVTSSTNPQANGSVIIKVKDKKIYYWNSQGGFVMDMPEMTVTPNPTTGSTGSSASNTMSDLEKYKESCKSATVADSLFVLPANIAFKDMSQMIHAMPTSAMPTGSQTGGYAVPTQYQQYLPK